MCDVIEWVKAGSIFFGSVIVPIVIGCVAQSYASAMKERELAAKYIELAADILKENKSPEVRDWAVDVINEYAKVKMSGKVKQEIRGVARISESGADSVSSAGSVQ